MGSTTVHIKTGKRIEILGGGGGRRNKFMDYDTIKLTTDYDNIILANG